MFNRSRRRLAYWFALSMGSILVLFAFATYYREVEDQLQAFDRSLYTKSKQIAMAARYQQLPGHKHEELVDVTFPDNMRAEDTIAYVRWYSFRGNLVYFTDANASKRLNVAPGFQTLKGSKQLQDSWLRQLTIPVKQDQTLIGYLQIADSLAPLQANLARMRLFLSLGVPATLSLVGLVGWFLGGLAMQPIRRSYEQLQRFTADASHELRAPLSAILSNAQVGLLTPVDDRAQQRQRLENIVAVTGTMSALIGNLLFLARHEGRLNPRELNKVDLVKLVQPLAEEYQALAKEQNLNFTAQLPTEPIALSADLELLQQAIRNLLSNAFKYTPSGGKIALKLIARPRRASIVVEDSGIGIPEEDLPHIFERFYRVDRARSLASGGFGLGLAIAQQIIQAHDGRITVKSTADKGTTFQIILPLR